MIVGLDDIGQSIARRRPGSRASASLLANHESGCKPPPMKFSELVSTPDELMGAKAVFGAIRSHVMCFGARGEVGENRRYSVASGAARRAVERPYVLAVGGGRQVRDNLGGRVVNVVRAGTLFGETAAFVPEEEARRLAQWPVGLLLHDVWAFQGYPHQIHDLSMPDLRLLAGAQDGIVRPEPRIAELWEALRDWPIVLQKLPAPMNVLDQGQPARVISHRPLFRGSMQSEEGQRLWKLQRSIESNQKLKSAAKELNRVKFGTYRCESCAYSSADKAMFDAHHPTPLCAGLRTTHAEDLLILCPTCHRRAHRKAPLDPFSLEELVAWIASGRAD